MKPISDTAFYCCGARLEDARQADPVCGDVYAKTFMDQRGLRISERFRGEAKANASNVVRHRIFDDHLRRALALDPNLRIAIIGAGFDSRAYRLNGGTWIEVDEPQVIEYKNAKLPVADCPHPLHRIPIDFGSESLEDKLAPFAADAGVMVVVEGVCIYLEQAAIEGLLRTLQRLFPQHQLLCDLMTRKFFERYTRTFHEKIQGMGAPVWPVDRPAEVFLRNGYRLRESTSIVGQAVAHRTIRIPRLALRLFLHTLAGGYRAYAFETV